ncbi:methyltransferase domain-containing protein [Porticoccaceae bacterium]|nr:methyltransferase domain-containing protein [Porticoccaceae bacterium]
MKSLPKLHLGAGHYHWPGFVNCDEETDLLKLPHEDEGVAEIHAIHLFEHLPRLDIEKYLAEWRRVLVPRGTLCLEMPSLDKMAQSIVNGEKNIRLTLLGIFGDPRDWDERPLMRHEWAWTEDELEYVLTSSGFKVEFADPIYHMNARDLRVIARKIYE